MPEEIWVDGKVEAWRESIFDKASIDQAWTQGWIESLREERHRLDSQKWVYRVSAGGFTFVVLATGAADARQRARAECRMHRETEPTDVEFRARRV